MEQSQRDIEHMRCDRTRRVATRLGAVQARLDLFEVPVGEVAPEEVIYRAGGFIEPEPLIVLRRDPNRFVRSRENPAIRQRQR